MKQIISVFVLRVALLSLILSGVGLCPICMNPIPLLADEARESSVAADQKKETDQSDASEKEKKEQPESVQPPTGIGGDQIASSINVTQAIQGQEGVTIQTMCTNCNEANLELGGLGDEHVNVNMDGFRLFGGLPRIYALSIIPSSAISKIDVTSGPGYAESYAEAIGGTLDLISHKPASKPLIQALGEAGSYGWKKEAIYADWKKGFFSGSAAGTKSHFNPIDANKDGHVETGKTDQWTAFADVQLNFNRAGNFTFAATKIRDEQIDGHGQVGRADTISGPLTYLNEDTFVDWNDYQFGYDIDLPKGHTIELRAVKYDRDQRIKSPTLLTTEEKLWRYLIEENNTYGNIKYQGIIGTRWILSAGFNSEDDVNTVSGVAMPADQPVLKESVKGWGAFSQASVDFMPQLSLSFGTRYDKSDISGKGSESNTYFRGGAQLSPRASLMWKPIRSISILTSYGYGFRPPRPVFNEICCGQSPESNSNIQIESSKNASIDFIYQPSPAWKFNTYLHRNDFEDFIIKMVGGSIQFHQKLMNGNIKDATIQGFDTSLSWKWSKGLSLSGSYSWVDAKNNGDTIDLYPHIFAPFDMRWLVTLPLKEIPYISDRGAQFAVNFTPPDNMFSINAQAQYTGSMLIQHYFYFDDVLSPPPGGLYEDYISTPSFWVVNLSGRITIKKHVELWLGVDNLTDYVQTDLGDFGRDHNWGPIRGRYYYGGLSYKY